MTALDRDHAEALASWANRRRGWDKPGSLAALGKVKQRNADDVAMAWVRFCADPNVNTPGAFPATTGPHWTERIAPPEPMRPPRREEECSAHPGSWQGSCNACRADQLAGDQTPRRTEASPITSEHVRSLRGIYAAATSALCSHGVPQRNCNQHDDHQPETLPEGGA